MAPRHTPAALAEELERLLPGVEKPTRYLGGEVNARLKPDAAVDLRVALAFPDLYEIGMSHLGFRILYALLNGLDGVAAERVFMPWTDMLGALRERGLPLTTLETRRPLADCDVVGFSLQYELTLTNALAMLETGGIAPLAAERGEDAPLVVAGGPVAFNPEPFAPFFDLILFGDAEEALPNLVEVLRRERARGSSRLDRIRAAAQLEGWYAPALYDAVPEPQLGMLIPRPRPGEAVPARVRRSVVYDLNRFPFPDAIVVPHAEIVHDRISWEVMRGCPVGCRFCQAGYIYRPTRERDPQAVAEGIRRSVVATGFDEFSLTSLNTGEYGAIVPLLTGLMDEMQPQHVAVGLSSLHATTLSEELVEQVRRLRKSGFTMAPEAGSQRLRDVISKNLTEDDILRAARLAFEGGWESLKLYFMIGLPTEEEADIDALVDLAARIAALGRSIVGGRAKVTLAASTFVPKAFTPFQWFGMEAESGFAAKQARIRSRVPRGVSFKHHDHRVSWLEGVLSRADRSVAPAILEAYRRGALFDGWPEHFDVRTWRAAFEACGIDADALATRPIPLEAELPWEIVDPLVRRRWLEREYERALAGKPSDTCVDACSGCAPFATECLDGVVAAQRWTTLPGLPAAAAPAVGVAAAASDATADAAAAAPATPVLTPAEPGAAAGPGNAPASSDAAPPATAPPPRPHYRYRARFEKLGRARFLGHLDMVRALTMGLRRARIEVAYSNGFKPLPKVSFSPALGLGIGSQAEYVDVETLTPLDPETALATINATLPEGLRLTAIVPIDLHATALQEAIRRAEYRATLPNVEPARLAAAVETFLASETFEIERERKGKRRMVDLRALVDRLEVDPEGGLVFRLAVSNEGSARPVEVVEAIGGPEAPSAATYLRTALYAERSGRLLSPLLVGRGRGE